MKQQHARPTTKKDETPEFIEFWQTWQKVKSEYDGRGLARDRFFYHIWWRGADPLDLVDGAKHYAANFKTGQLRLLASNWLDRGSYEDGAERWRQSQAAKPDTAERASNVVSIQPMKKIASVLGRSCRGLEAA